VVAERRALPHDRYESKMQWRLPGAARSLIKMRADL
jgi:hypothetical protein